MNTITNRHSSDTGHRRYLLVGQYLYLQHFSRVSNFGNYLDAMRNAANSLQIMCTPFLCKYEFQRNDKLVFWLVRCLLCLQGSFIYLDGWGKKTPQITRRHLPQDITMCVPSLRFRIALVMFVGIRGIFSQPRITEGNPPKSTRTFQKYLLHRPIPVAAPSKP